jgi:Family of unknown function (DUF6370)
MVGLAAVILLALTSPGFAAGDEETITGKGMCAKCMLKETSKCQTVIQVERDGKKINYYLAPNATSKDFHENVCQEAKKVTATGTVKKVGDKLELTASKIELAK